MAVSMAVVDKAMAITIQFTKEDNGCVAFTEKLLESFSKKKKNIPYTS